MRIPMIDRDVVAQPLLNERLASSPRSRPVTSFVTERALVGRLAVLLLVLLAFGCQTYHLARQSLWYDEAVTARVAAQGVVELTRWTADDIQPPLYYYVVAAWTRVAGRSEWALRFPSVFFGLLLVPLLWALARRLFGRDQLGRLAAGLAALLTALSPLYTYYAQEARMYTQLTALAALVAYALLRATAPHQSVPAASLQIARAAGGRRLPWSLSTRQRWWSVFVLAAVAALYTHYFAAFVLLALAMFFVVAWALTTGRRRETAWRSLRPALVAGAAVVLLYLPWLPAMLNRLQVDRSYWQGALKLDEALRHLAISYTVAAPETMLESEAVRWLPWFAAAFAICLITLLASVVHGPRRSLGEGARIVGANLVFARRRSTNRAPQSEHTLPDARSGMNPAGAAPAGRALAFLLLALVIPVLGVLALASRTPKFNARYLMIASPAYLLILAGGLSRVFAPALPGVDKQSRVAPGLALLLRWPAWPGRLLAAAILLLLVLVPGKAQSQWLTGDPGFTKAQWREVAAAVRREIAPGEAVMLVSGHAAPAWDYYAPDIPAIRLPDIDVLDVRQVLGFASGATLQAALAGKTGVWVVFWQASVIDPLDFTTYYLDRAGREMPTGRQFWQLRLRHWQLRPDASYPDRPQPQHAAGADQANFAHQLALLGWDEPQDRQLTLYWQALNTIGAHDYQVSLHFEDEAGREVAPRWDGRPAAYAYPTDRWLPGQPLFGRYPLPALPPGRYYVSVAVYDAEQPAGLNIMDVADNPAGKRVRLGPFVVR